MLDCKINTVNTILYCKHWQKTVEFYKELLNLPVTLTTDWFVEFRLNEKARLSVADERRASIKSSQGKGITISVEVDDIEKAFYAARNREMNPTEIKRHAWDANTFFLFDPEGNRLEIWQPIS
jgi:catechol 2,3-dioxygenase-like lactoylglutathione lyase family enzyme